jgi:uncharacterized membrane protein
MTRLILLALLLAPSLAHGHSKHRSTSRWRFRVAQGAVGVTMAFEASDMSLSIALKDDPPPDGASVDDRLAHVKQRAFSELAGLISVTSDGKVCPMHPLRFLRKTFYEVGLRWDCGAPLGEVVVTLSLMDRLPTDHKQMARLDIGGRHDVRAFTRQRNRFTHSFGGSPPGAASNAKLQPAPRRPGTPTIGVAEAQTIGFGELVGEGVMHIMSGWDHILFLIALLAAGGTFVSLVQVVTAFTLAHSITLALAYTGVVSLDAAIVEPAIAATIVFVAVENIWVKEPARRWVLTFGFGLVHGLGFAGFLAGLQLPPDSLVSNLLAFNVGVELGQLAVVALAFPILRLAATKSWQRQRVVIPLSVMVAAAGIYWFLERTALG